MQNVIYNYTYLRIGTNNVDLGKCDRFEIHIIFTFKTLIILRIEVRNTLLNMGWACTTRTALLQEMLLVLTYPFITLPLLGQACRKLDQFICISYSAVFEERTLVRNHFEMLLVLSEDLVKQWCTNKQYSERMLLNLIKLDNFR